eukprot:105409-Amorphochlora_amoeboformis.AAC.1
MTIGSYLLHRRLLPLPRIGLYPVDPCHAIPPGTVVELCNTTLIPVGLDALSPASRHLGGVGEITCLNPTSKLWQLLQNGKEL